MSDLDKYRKKLDEIDEEIIELLATRAEVIKKVAQFKVKNDLKPFQAKRHDAVLKSRTQHASAKSLEENFIKSLWQLILNDSVRIQKEILNEK